MQWNAKKYALNQLFDQTTTMDSCGNECRLVPNVCFFKQLLGCDIGSDICMQVVCNASSSVLSAALAMNRNFLMTCWMNSIWWGVNDGLLPSLTNWILAPQLMVGPLKCLLDLVTSNSLSASLTCQSMEHTTLPVSQFHWRCISANCFHSESQVMVCLVLGDSKRWFRSAWLTHLTPKSSTTKLNWIGLVTWVNNPAVCLISWRPNCSEWSTTMSSFAMEPFSSSLWRLQLIWAQTHPGLSTSAWRLCCDWKSFGVWLRLNLVHCESQRRLFGCTLLMSNVENFAPWVDETEFNSILMVQMLVLLVAVSLSHSDKCPHAVIPLLNGLPIFSGQRANPTQGSVTLSFLGTSHPGMNSETSMPLVSLKPWNKFPSSFPTDFWQQSGFACGCIDGSNFERAHACNTVFTLQKTMDSRSKIQDAFVGWWSDCAEQVQWFESSWCQSLLCYHLQIKVEQAATTLSLGDGCFAFPSGILDFKRNSQFHTMARVVGKTLTDRPWFLRILHSVCMQNGSIVPNFRVWIFQKTIKSELFLHQFIPCTPCLKCSDCVGLESFDSLGWCHHHCLLAVIHRWLLQSAMKFLCLLVICDFFSEVVRITITALDFAETFLGETFFCFTSTAIVIKFLTHNGSNWVNLLGVWSCSWTQASGWNFLVFPLGGWWGFSLCFTWDAQQSLKVWLLVLIHLEGCLPCFLAVAPLITGGKMLPSQVVQVQVCCKMLGRILLCQRFWLRWHWGWSTCSSFDVLVPCLHGILWYLLWGKDRQCLNDTWHAWCKIGDSMTHTFILTTYNIKLKLQSGQEILTGHEPLELCLTMTVWTDLQRNGFFKMDTDHDFTNLPWSPPRVHANAGTKFVKEGQMVWHNTWHTWHKMGDSMTHIFILTTHHIELKCSQSGQEILTHLSVHDSQGILPSWNILHLPPHFLGG